MSEETQLEAVQGSAFRSAVVASDGAAGCGSPVRPAPSELSQAAPSAPLHPVGDAEREKPEGGRHGAVAPAPMPVDRMSRRAEARRRRSNERIIRRRKDPATGQEAGMATAEYAIATLAAVAFAALLVAVLSSGEIKGLLMSLITSALNFG